MKMPEAFMRFRVAPVVAGLHRGRHPGIGVRRAAPRTGEPSMRRRLLTVTLVMLGTISLAATLARAQTTSAGPYYATPSWDQTLPVATRFIVLSNFNSEAVLDRETGLAV